MSDLELAAALGLGNLVYGLVMYFYGARVGRKQAAEQVLNRLVGAAIAGHMEHEEAVRVARMVLGPLGRDDR